MKIIESLEKRRSYYDIDKEVGVSKDKIVEMIKSLTELVPDAFNMKSSRVVVLFDKKHELLWDEIYSIFNGAIPRDKINSFKSGFGTILYFYDENTVKSLQDKYNLYASNFPIWANQASAMLQLSIWSGLRECGIGASLQYYNPVIDERVKEVFNIPKNYKLIAQMPFGGIKSEPDKKEKENIDKRVTIID